jgi:hypothetical protein
MHRECASGTSDVQRVAAEVSRGGGEPATGRGLLSRRPTAISATNSHDLGSAPPSQLKANLKCDRPSTGLKQNMHPRTE